MQCMQMLDRAVVTSYDDFRPRRGDCRGQGVQWMKSVVRESLFDGSDAKQRLPTIGAYCGNPESCLREGYRQPRRVGPPACIRQENLRTHDRAAPGEIRAASGCRKTLRGNAVRLSLAEGLGWRRALELYVSYSRAPRSAFQVGRGLIGRVGQAPSPKGRGLDGLHRVSEGGPCDCWLPLHFLAS